MLALNSISFLWGPWLVDVLHFLMVCLKQSWRKSVLNIHWKDWCWSWNSKSLATWWEGLTHWNRSWCWERLNTGEGNDRGWDSWMASLTQWTWVWASSWSWWWTGRPGVLQSMGLQRVRHDWVTELKLPNFGTHRFTVVFLKIFIWLHWILVVACEIFHCGAQTLVVCRLSNVVVEI